MNELYSSEERTKLTGFTNVYNSAIADYAAKKAEAEQLAQATILHPQFTQLAADAQLKAANAEAAKQFAAQAKIDLDDYQRFLTGKYQQSFMTQHPELAPTLTQIAANANTELGIGQANAQSATDIALGLAQNNAAKSLADAEKEAADKAAAQKKMYLYIGGGVVALILIFLVYKQMKNKNN